jgi:hypothetical protein
LWVAVALGALVSGWLVWDGWNDTATPDAPALEKDELPDAASEVPQPAAGVTIEGVTLVGAANASGLVVTHSEKGLVVVTVSDQPGNSSHLQYWFEDGRSAGSPAVTAARGVEALTLRAGRVTELRVASDGALNLADGSDTETLLTAAGRRVLTDRLCSEACDMESEGLAWRGGRWHTVATFSKASTGPLQRPLAVYWLRFEAPGRTPEVIGPVRYGSGQPLREFVAALDITPSGLAIMPGFRTSGIRLVDERGLVVGEVVLPTARVEGVFWHQPSERLFLVRECPGSGSRCGGHDPSDLLLWKVTLPESMLAAWFRAPR